MKHPWVAVLIASQALLGFDHGWCSTGASRALLNSGAAGIPDPRIAPFPPDRWIVPKDRAPLSRHTSVPGDENWWDGFGLPVTDGSVNAAINYQGSLVIAGRFTRIGNVKANNIARWDGTAWIPLGTGIEWGTIGCLVIHQGDLVAGGDFWYAGGVIARSVARWNGSTWSAFGEGLHDPNTNPRTVVSLASQGDTLVAAQDVFYEYSFPNPPNSAPTWPYLASLWTGSEWVDLPGGNGAISSLAFFNGALFAGGIFDSLGGAPAERIARWDGASWSEVGGGLGSSTWVAAMTIHSGQLILGGAIDSAGSMDVGNIATWDGAQWGALGAVPEVVTTLSSAGGDLIAGGSSMVARWNGQSWDFPTPPLEGTPSSLVTLGSDLIVTGPIAATNTGDAAPAAISVARVSNGVWVPLMPVDHGMQGLVGLDGFGYVGSLVAHRGHILAAGQFQYAGSPPGWARVNGLAEWTGAEWTPFPRPADFEYISSLLSQRDTLYAAGWSNNAPLTPAIWRHDGIAWAPMGTQPGPAYAMTTYRGSLVAAFDDFSVRRWNGSDWEEIGHADGSLYPYMACMIEWNGKLVVAGRFRSINGVPAYNIAAWNGSAWDSLGPGLPPSPYRQDAIIRALGLADGRIAAAGDPVDGVVSWSGTAWEPLGTLHGQAYLLQAGPHLFASGYFYNSHLSREFYLVRWNGDDWVELGSGTNSPVYSLAALGSSVYMGGYFSEAGGRASYAMARWDGLPVQQITPTLEAGRPNPFASATAFSYVLPAPGTVRLSIHDVTGREIAVIDEGARSSGPHTAIWSGRLHSGDKAPSGVYFLRAALPGGVHKARKVILLR